MQIVLYKIEDKTLMVGFKELDNKGDNFVVYTQLFNDISLSKQELLKKAYMQIKDTIEYEKTLEQHGFITDKQGEEFKLEDSKPIKLEIDFNNLKGKVLDQYGSIVSENIIFSIEGTDKAKIKDGKIIEESVLIDTDYFIVAKFRDLIEKQKRTIYAAKVVKEVVDNEKVAMAEAIVDLNNRVLQLENKLNGGK